MAEPTASEVESFDLKETLQWWRERLVDRIAVADLISRSEIAHKWKAPYRCLVVREALLRRMLDLGTSIDVLTDQRQILGTRILLRCAIEATALLEFMSQKFDDVVARKLQWSDFESDTMKILAGCKNATSSTNFEAFNIITVVNRASRSYSELEKMHQKLSESVHPNYEGVLYAYARPVPEEHETIFGDFWMENFGHQHVPGTAYVFSCFVDAYDNHWIDSMCSLEQWLRDNDQELEAAKGQTLPTAPSTR